MRILVTNDDGIHAPGLEALARELRSLGEVRIVAPLSEQSGVAHSITYLTPLMAREIVKDHRHFGHAVAGSPADCVKLAVLELCPERPDLIVSGINSGSNSGIDVLYSGTVAAAIEGAFFGITSVAVSLVADSNPDYETAARWGLKVIRELLDQGIPEGSLWNVNVPDSRPGWPRGVRVVPISVERGRDVMLSRVDPRGRTYYWAATDDTWKPPHAADSDVEGLAEGYVTVTPLQFNLTHRPLLHAWREHGWTVSPDIGDGSH